MHYVARYYQATARLAPILVFAVAALSPVPAAARSVRVLAFNATFNTAYDARQNVATRHTIASSRSGSLDYTFDAANGDRLEFARAGLAPPPPPVFKSVTSDGLGCALATWLPSGDPTVVGYVVYVGTRSVAAGKATQYDVAIDAGNASSANVCELTASTVYFAVRARNHAGMLSAYSAERSLTITTVAVRIMSFDGRVDETGVHLSWDVSADEVIQGYRVYRSEGDGPETAIGESLLPVDAREFVDTGTRSATSYRYVLTAVREDGSEVRSAPVTIATPALVLALDQNAPNPFNPSTRIPFTMAHAGRVVIRVYDVRGSLVATVHDGTLSEGRHVVSWNGQDSAGRPVASGVYVYALTADRQTLSKKMMLLK